MRTSRQPRWKLLAAVLALALQASCSCKISVRTAPDATPDTPADVGSPWTPFAQFEGELQPLHAAAGGGQILVGGVVRGATLRNVVLRSTDRGVTWLFKAFYWDWDFARVSADATSATVATAATFVSSGDYWSLLNRPQLRKSSPIIGVANFQGAPYIAVEAAEPCTAAPGSSPCDVLYAFDGRSWVEQDRSSDIALLLGTTGAYAGIKDGPEPRRQQTLFSRRVSGIGTYERVTQDSARRPAGALGLKTLVLWNQATKQLEFYDAALRPIGVSPCPSWPLFIVALDNGSAVFGTRTELFLASAGHAPVSVRAFPDGSLVSAGTLAAGRIVVVGLGPSGANGHRFWSVGSDDNGSTWRDLYEK